jgi:hypothetical protein
MARRTDLLAVYPVNQFFSEMARLKPGVSRGRVGGEIGDSTGAKWLREGFWEIVWGDSGEKKWKH